MLKIKAEKREAGKQLGTTRADGLVPAVVYGPEQEPQSITLPAGDFGRVYAKAGGSTLVELELPGEKEPVIVIIKEVQKHPVKGNLAHADLLAVKMGEEMHVDVSLEFIGEAPVEKRGEGVVSRILRELEIAALPKDLPHELTVDISSLDQVGDQITIEDVKLPEGVRVIGEPDAIVVHAVAITEEEIEEGAPEGGLPEGELEAQAGEAQEGEAVAEAGEGAVESGDGGEPEGEEPKEGE